MENKISVVINTYNAEKHLEKVLESVSQFDEIVICDMESTDHTLEIAQKHGCKIVTFQRKQYNICEPARNFAIQAASFPWVLVVDADELITEELRIYLYKLIEKDNLPNGIYIPRKNFFMGKFMHCYYPDYILRFFKKDSIDWPPYIHSVPQVVGKTIYIDKKDKQLAFIHLADESIVQIITKMNDYTDNEAKKRANKNYSYMALITKPAFRFFKSYIIKGGFRDGKPGFIRAVLDGYYQFIAISKIFYAKYQSNK